MGAKLCVAARTFLLFLVSDRRSSLMITRVLCCGFGDANADQAIVFPACDQGPPIEFRGRRDLSYASTMRRLSASFQLPSCCFGSGSSSKKMKAGR
jgi:hypothetical protein